MNTAELFPLDGKRPPERHLQRMGFMAVAGVDEVGRGCIAGPVVAAAVILKKLDAKFIAAIDDSKKLAAPERERLEKLIRRWAVAVAVAEVSNEEIDRINILQASFKAMRMALDQLPVPADYVLVDGHMKIPGLELPQRAIVQGDGLCKSIGAASIVAKVHRDRWMMRQHEKYPMYGFLTNKGYGTAEHWEGLRKHGPCPLHRFSFQGVANPENAEVNQLALEEV